MNEIPVTLLRKLITYDPENGSCLWLPRKPWMFENGQRHSREHICNRWNVRYSGKEVGCADKDGYRVANVFGSSFKVHRMIWALVTGAWPVNEIDHDDTVPSNNRWVNLRDASRQQNSANKQRYANNTSGLKRVSWSKTMNRWESRIQVDGKNIVLCYSDCPAVASFAYQIASDKYFGKFARTA